MIIFVDGANIFSSKSIKITTPLGTKDHKLEKVPVAGVALTLFNFFNPSNVLASIWTPKLIFRKVNIKYYWGRVKIHLPRSKNRKTRMLFFPRFWEHSGPTFALRRQIGRRIMQPIEARLLPLQ